MFSTTVGRVLAMFASHRLL